MNEFPGSENIPLKSVRPLRDFEHDIVAIVEDSPGAKDEDVLQRGYKQSTLPPSDTTGIAVIAMAEDSMSTWKCSYKSKKNTINERRQR